MAAPMAVPHCQQIMHGLSHSNGFRCLRKLSRMKKISSNCTIPRVSHSSGMGKKVYWDQFYAGRKSAEMESFDWFFSHDVARPRLTECIRRLQTEKHRSHGLSLLELGCGTSTLASNLLKDHEGVSSMVCTDFCPDAVTQARSLSRRVLSDDKSIHFVVADATRLPFKEGQFDLVFEKGLLDAMLISNNSSLARTSFGEALRILQPRGVFLQLSDEHPDLRLTFLEEALLKNNLPRSHVSVTFQEIGCSFGTEYFMYVIDLNRSQSIHT